MEAESLYNKNKIQWYPWGEYQTKSQVAGQAFIETFPSRAGKLFFFGAGGVCLKQLVNRKSSALGKFIIFISLRPQ